MADAEPMVWISDEELVRRGIPRHEVTWLCMKLKWEAMEALTIGGRIESPDVVIDQRESRGRTIESFRLRVPIRVVESCAAFDEWKKALEVEDALQESNPWDSRVFIEAAGSALDRIAQDYGISRMVPAPGRGGFAEDDQNLRRRIRQMLAFRSRP